MVVMLKKGVAEVVAKLKLKMVEAEVSFSMSEKCSSLIFTMYPMLGDKGDCRYWNPTMKVLFFTTQKSLENYL